MGKSYLHVAIANYPGAQLTAVHGLTDMFLTANRFINSLKMVNQSLFCVSHWGVSDNDTKLNSEYCTLKSVPFVKDVLILPGSLDEQAPTKSQALTEWILTQYQSGTVTCSVCNGAFVLAQSGILNGRKATTHWALEDVFFSLYPETELHIDRIIIDEGDIVTAGGVMAWLDLGLSLIHRFAGPEVMLKVAKFLLIDPHAREQKFYRAFSPSFSHGDQPIIKVQHWLQANIDKPLSLEQLANLANVSVRTLIRRFHSALKITPTAYIQQVRVEKARELLEFTTFPVNKVAWSVGYEDPSAFGKLFHKIQGLSPGEYRRRFRIK